MTSLLDLLADGQFHTGPKLAACLGISRAAINLQVQNARSRGITVESVPSKGYRLPGGADWLNLSKLSGALRRSYPGIDVQLHASIPSTNELLLQQSSGWPDRQVVFAEHQTAGRGRRGRTWVSSWGHNLFFSFAIIYQDGIPEALSLRVGVGLADLLYRSGVTGIGLKWPNDLWVADHKCGGILVEVQGDPMGHCRAVIGVGLNLLTPTAVAGQIDQPFGDLRHLGLKPEIHRTLLAGRAARAVIQSAEAESEHWQADFARWDCLRDRHVSAIGVHQTWQGRAVGVESDGGLRLATEQGVQVFRSGEVSVRTNAGL